MLAVGLYVAGMIVDYLAWLLTRPLKPLVRRWAERKYKRWGSEAQSGTLRQAKIALYAPDLAKELMMRSSRDRIARGLIINSILAGHFLLGWQRPETYALIAFSIVLWAGFEKLSYSYELSADQLVDEKLARESTRR